MPKFDKVWEKCTQEKTRIVAHQRLHGAQPEENQALYLMPRKAREGEGIPSITSAKIRDQVLPQIKRNKRRIYLRSNATGARNTVIMPVAVEVPTKGSVKLQLPMSKKTLLTRSEGRMIVWSSSSKK